MDLLRLLVLIFLFSPCAFGASALAGECGDAYCIYVSNEAKEPGRSAPSLDQVVADARAARKKFPNRDVHVVFKPGVYYLSSTLKFDERDSSSGDARIVYMSSGEGDVVFSGGANIANWTPVGKGLCEAKASFLTRNLYSSAVQFLRARQPNAGSVFRIKSWPSVEEAQINAPYFEVNVEDVEALSGLSGGEVHVQRDYVSHIVGLDKVDIVEGSDGKKKAFLRLRRGDGTLALKIEMPKKRVGQAFYIEGNESFIDSDAEWAQRADLSIVASCRHVLSGSSVIAGKLPALVSISGQKGSPVRNLRFQGITFSHSSWPSVASTGFVARQANVYGLGQDADGKRTVLGIPAAVEANFAYGVEFVRCRFQDLGGDALKFGKGVRASTIDMSVFRRIGGTAIAVATALKPVTDEDEWVADISVIGNSIQNIGGDFTGAVGVFVGYSSGVRIQGNSISDVPYSAVSLGWGWGKEYSPQANGNVISENKISRSMRVLSDGGAIYVLGGQKASVISNNEIDDFCLSGNPAFRFAAGIYLDHGADGFSLMGNRVSVCKAKAGDRVIDLFNQRGNRYVEKSRALLP